MEIAAFLWPVAKNVYENIVLSNETIQIVEIIWTGLEYQFYW